MYYYISICKVDVCSKNYDFIITLPFTTHFRVTDESQIKGHFYVHVSFEVQHVSSLENRMELIRIKKMGTFRNELLIVKVYILKIVSAAGRLITLPVQKEAEAVVVFYQYHITCG